jgi:hypothetical protein
MKTSEYFSMKKIKCIALFLTIGAVIALPTITKADVVLEYAVKGINVPAGTTQNIAVKNDQIMVKAAGGDKNLDLLYRHALEDVIVVNHSKATVMTVDEQGIDRINQQTQNLQPLLQGLGGQLGNLAPEQRQQLQELFGDSVSLDAIAKAAEPQASTRVIPAGMKKVAGISCRKMRVMQGTKPVAEFCMADAASMNVSDKDAATVRGFFGLYERLVPKTQGLARQQGITLPNITAREMGGIPVEFRDLSGKNNVTMIMLHSNTSIVSPEVMRIPSGYKAVPFTLLQLNSEKYCNANE